MKRNKKPPSEGVIYRIDINDKLYVICQRIEIGRLKPRKAVEEIICLLDALEYVPMQKCPKCDGQGHVSKPPGIKWTRK